jgi:hypothetical protein
MYSFCRNVPTESFGTGEMDIKNVKAVYIWVMEFFVRLT